MATLFRLLVVFAAVPLAITPAPAHADPGPGPGMCQFLGANYNVWYPCNQDQPWLQYGTADNAPYGSPLPTSDCAPPRQHNIGCS